jgi:hypothetical protein
MAGESPQQNADRTMWSKKNSLQEVQISHTAPFLGTQKVDHVQLQIPDKQEKNI